MTQFSSLYGERLHRELGTDDTVNLFTVPRRKSAINEAAQEFADLTECFTREVIFTVNSTTNEYDLNSTLIIPSGDFSRIAKDGLEFTYVDASSAVTVVSGDDEDGIPRRDIPWLNREYKGWRQSTVAAGVQQLPTYHYLREDGGSLYLGFVPFPSSGSSATMTCRLRYCAQVAPMTSDTSEPFTINGVVRTDLRPYHQGIVHGGAGKLEKYRRDDQAIQAQLGQFQGYIARYAQALRIKGQKSISQAREYFRRRSS